ncbi:MAG: glycosyltransferase family 4 protein [Anaerolineae bacterium]|nr:glycosyltransferase family 4 protein [Phycisphaerae bacterium]
MSDRPLRILHLTLGADAGGLSQYIIALGSAMVAQGHQVSVAGDTGAWQWAFDESPLKYIQIPLKGNWFSFQKSARILREHLKDNPVDVIHTHYRRATLLGRKLQSKHGRPQHTRAGRHPAINKIPPLVYTLHLSHLSLRFPRNLFSDFGDISHVASLEARDWLTREARTPEDRIRFIPHGIDLNRFTPTTCEQRAEARKQLMIAPNDRVAVFVGRYDYPKNEDWLIDLAASARAILPNLKIFLVGEGPHEADLKLRIASENLMDRVFVTGYQDPLPYYRAADAILLPSIREGFSFVCAEAMATGIPALRTRTSGTRELILENTTGRSVPIDHDLFIDTAITFLRDGDELRRMGADAAEHVRKNFSFDLQLSRTLDLYRSITKLS